MADCWKLTERRRGVHGESVWRLDLYKPVRIFYHQFVSKVQEEEARRAKRMSRLRRMCHGHSTTTWILPRNNIQFRPKEKHCAHAKKLPAEKRSTSAEGDNRAQDYPAIRNSGGRGESPTTSDAYTALATATSVSKSTVRGAQNATTCVWSKPSTTAAVMLKFICYFNWNNFVWIYHFLISLIQFWRVLNLK